MFLRHFKNIALQLPIKEHEYQYHKKIDIRHWNYIDCTSTPKVLLVGIIGLIFSRWRVRSLRLQKDMFGIGCALLVFPICPAIIALSVLELVYVSGLWLVCIVSMLFRYTIYSYNLLYVVWYKPSFL